MKTVTRSQKIYLAALGVGLCALVYDKTSGGGPEAAAAASAVATPAPVAPSTAAPPAAVLPPVPADPTLAAFDRGLAGRLAALAHSAAAGGDRDGFAPAAGWLSDRVARTGPSVDAARFRQQHTLKAVVQGRRPQAMVDSSLITLGQSVDGFTLVAVDRMRAVFSDGQGQAELSLAGADPRPVNPPTP